MASREGNLGFCAFTHHNVKMLSLQSFPPPPLSLSLSLSLSRSLALSLSLSAAQPMYPLRPISFVRYNIRNPLHYALSVTISVIRDNIRYP